MVWMAQLEPRALLAMLAQLEAQEQLESKGMSELQAQLALEILAQQVQQD
jgi:hypothetical protein